MAAYKINRNKKPLSDEQIERHKSFSKLMQTQQELHQYKNLRKPLYKNIKVLSIIVVVCTIILLLILDQFEQEAPQEKSPAIDTVPAQQIIRSSAGASLHSDSTGQTFPVQASSIPSAKANTAMPAALQLNWKKYTLIAEEGGIVYPGNGHRILIQPNTFKDAQGNLIKGQVEVLFREYRNSFDFLRAGVNMQWNKEQTLISKGMFDLFVTQNEKQLILNKEIIVDLLRIEDQQEYQLYFYNPNTKAWTQTAKETKKETFFIAEQSGSDERYYASRTFSVFQNVQWELVSAPSMAIFKSLLRTPASAVQVKQLRGETFTLLISSGADSARSTTITANLTPIFADPAKHQAWVNSLYKQYQQSVSRQQAAIAKAQQEYQVQINSPEYKKWLAWVNSPEYKKVELGQNVYSRFAINQFGTWNCDRPQNLPKGASVNPAYAVDNKAIKKPETVYLVDYSNNSLYSYYATVGGNFQFDPSSKNIIVCVLDTANIGIFSKEDFSKVPSQGNFTFNLKKVNVRGMSEQQLNALFSLPTHVTTKEEIMVSNKVNTPPRTIMIRQFNSSNFKQFDYGQ